MQQTPPPFAPGFLERQQEPPAGQGAAALPPATEGAQPATVEEEPVPPCPEGQILDEETGLCVIEEPEVAEEEPEQQSSEEEDGSEDNSGSN